MSDTVLDRHLTGIRPARIRQENGTDRPNAANPLPEPNQPTGTPTGTSLRDKGDAAAPLNTIGNRQHTGTPDGPARRTHKRRQGLPSNGETHKNTPRLNRPENHRWRAPRRRSKNGGRR
jgi:hypothetical protein